MLLNSFWCLLLFTRSHSTKINCSCWYLTYNYITRNHWNWHFFDPQTRQQTRADDITMKRLTASNSRWSVNMVSVSASSRRLSHSRTQIFRFLRLGGPSSCCTSKYPSCRRKRNATMRFCDSSSAILVGVWPRFRLNASQNATKTRPKRDQNATKTRGVI